MTLLDHFLANVRDPQAKHIRKQSIFIINQLIMGSGSIGIENEIDKPIITNNNNKNTQKLITPASFTQVENSRKIPLIFSGYTTTM